MSAPHDMGPPKRRTKPPLVRPQRVADLVEIKKIVVFRGVIEDGFKPRPRLRTRRIRFAKYYVSFRGGNGQVLSTSQGYKSPRSAWNLAVGTLRQLNGHNTPHRGRVRSPHAKVSIALGAGITNFPPPYRTLIARWSA